MSQFLRTGLAALFLAGAVSMAEAAERKLEARLIWGTNEEKSPDPSHKLLDGDIAKKLREMPLKWKNYFEINKQFFTINDQRYTNIVMSKQCTIEVKDKGANNVTVKLYGQGKPVNRIDKPLPKGEVLAIGGDAKNNSAWFVTVRPVVNEAKNDGKKEKAVDPKNAPIAKPAQLSK